VTSGPIIARIGPLAGRHAHDKTAFRGHVIEDGLKKRILLGDVFKHVEEEDEIKLFLELRIFLVDVITADTACPAYIIF